MSEYIYLHLTNIIIVGLVFLPLERLLPRNKDQKALRIKWSMDLVYALLGGLFSALGQVAVIALGVLCFAPFIPETLTSIVSSQHIVLQVIGIALVADVWYYFSHRTFHRIPALWRFHAIHHSIEEMDWLAAHRVHPVDQTLTTGVSLVWPIILGFSAPAFAVYIFLRKWHSLLKHSNVNVSFGVFSKIIVSPVFHHWHHANQKEAYDKNFAGVFSALDRIFGTAITDEAKSPEVYGVDDPLPESFSHQLVSPFLPGPAQAAVDPAIPD